MPAPLTQGYALDPAFARLKSLVIERTGHFYYQDKDDLLWERVRKRLRETGKPDCSAYLALLEDPGFGDAEWARLEAEITIGETFFFRYVEQFAALREVILPEIIARKRGEKRLRIWSAGCATGAEAYSIAILLTELLGEDLANWRVRIIGTDINETFLETARRARFGQWALRSLTPAEKSAYFVPAAERAQWQLRPEFRSLVGFERHNLLSLLDGTSPLQFTEFDLILCRNVLIYFHPETVHRVVEALRDTLLEGGWMLLGHAEPNPAFAAMMQALNLPGTTAYRHLPGDGSQAAPAVAEEPFAPVPWLPAIPTDPAPASERTEWSSPKVLPALPIDEIMPVSQAAVLLRDVRRLADAGHLEEADALCKRGLRDQPIDPIFHFFQGLIAQTLGRDQEAEKAFRDSIYLDKRFVMAHYHLGLHLISRHHAAAGQRSVANALRLAADLPDDCPLEEGDGLTAKDFRTMVRARLKRLTTPRQEG
ncbi:CheR family methyltransferase [Microvirga antarctica]|uniref:CheR family methyltransferase n=1 Tax=Microvirga antarctica TaxID=2819233 RepID=UPI001B309E80|nr:protein-glutamate O-methyltransferase CheR [Microvirga antarctica]